MLILWSVFFCEIQSLIVSTQVRTIQATRTKILLNFHESKGKEL